MRSHPVRAALAAASLVVAVAGFVPSPTLASSLVDDTTRLPTLGAIAGDQGASTVLAAIAPDRDAWATDGRDGPGVQAARDAGVEHLAAVEALVEAARAATAPAPAPAPAAAAASSSTPPARPVATTQRPSYAGVNHMWFPALGYDRSVTAYPCSSSAFPANVVYRWGCAGTNNVYLFGHAWGVMKPLHDAYVAGRLRVGMVVVYADGTGAVHTYRITTWRLVVPADSAWAIAAQPVPSMTLQTCVGANSEYRLVVRLVRIS